MPAAGLHSQSPRQSFNHAWFTTTMVGCASANFHLSPSKCLAICVTHHQTQIPQHTPRGGGGRVSARRE
jgi:hypothetical protein